MEILEFRYEAGAPPPRRAHAGVVGSGDLEVLLEPAAAGAAAVTVRTGVDGYGAVWRNVLDRFFARHRPAVTVTINDFGATPGMVTLRLEQALEESEA
jgi:malonate decarboxylase delta subunit